MSGSLATDIETWEDEGGAVRDSPGASATSMSGTAAQVEWAERIKRRVSAEFDRVAASFRSVACKQGDDRRADTEAIVAILEEKRVEVMRREQAGYFIRDWQEISDQVRQMILRDPRFQAIQKKKAGRQRCSPRGLRAFLRGRPVTGWPM